MNLISLCNRFIRWSFYTIFLLVPFVFAGDTSELFELNKIWLLWIVTLIIGFFWIAKTVLQRRIFIQRTPLDIPILLFLFSQIFSTIFSIDHHISWWGYYSRFNGGLLSTITYIFLYYAFVSTIEFSKVKEFVIRCLTVSLLSGLIVSLWGLPSHFGYDPTCLIFRGSFDVSCWTDAFQPKVRIFSTMGQPDWLAAYLSILIPVSLAFALNTFFKSLQSTKNVVGSMYHVVSKNWLHTTYYILLTTLFYLDFLYTRSKGSFIALIISLVLFFVGIVWITRSHLSRKFIIQHSLFVILFLTITFFAKTPFQQFNVFTFDHLTNTFSKIFIHTQKITTNSPISSQTTQAKANPITGELGGTDSGRIRLFVWKGALDIFLHNPLFGSGVETFAYAYYLYRPAGHNLTSEWDYLYNKAHNEYLNYLATTGAFGLGSYLLMIGWFLYVILAKFVKSSENHETLFILALLSGYITILISNFFGFSVVIVNLYLFMIPAFVFILSETINPKNVIIFPNLQSTSIKVQTINVGQWIGISVTGLIGLYCILVLINYRSADIQYALGYNLDRAGQYQQAYPYLHQAVDARPSEPTFKDEMAVNDGVLAVAFFSQKDATNAGKLAQEALQVSNEITTNYPHNVTFWKSRVRILYSLSQIDPQFIKPALDSILTAQKLAPTDAKIAYNAGILFAQNGQVDKGIEVLQQTIRLKPDYKDVYYALALELHQAALDKNNKVIDPQKETQAVAALHFILDKLSPGDTASTQSLKSWGEM